MRKQILFDGQKTVNLNDLPREAWTYLTGGEAAGDIQEYYKSVPLIWRGVDLIANTVASLPFAIVNEAGEDVDTSDDYQNVLGFMPNPKDWRWLVAASMELLGRAYLFHEHNRVKTLGLRFVLASSISPVLDGDKGLVGFVRQRGQQRLELDVEDVIYFWGRDPFVEVGPPADDKSPVQAALVAAGVLHNLGKYASAYFERGAVRPMVMTLPGAMPPKVEQTRIKSWLQRIFMGVDNAWGTQIFQEGTEFHTIGDGISELSSSELTQEQREDVLTALGIPITVMYSNEAGGLGGGGVVTGDERKFYQQKIIPAAGFLSATLNEQLLRPMGYRWVDRPETLDIFQADENERSQSFERYVNAGFRMSVAAQMLGIELPSGIKYEDLDQMREEDKEAAASRMPDFGNPQQNQQPGARQEAMRADLERWERKALAKGADAPFESEFIPPALMESIKGSIQELGVEAAFAFLKKKGS